MDKKESMPLCRCCKMPTIWRMWRKGGCTSSASGCRHLRQAEAEVAG